jgi:hypothetical protein
MLSQDRASSVESLQIWALFERVSSLKTLCTFASTEYRRDLYHGNQAKILPLINVSG